MVCNHVAFYVGWACDFMLCLCDKYLLNLEGGAIRVRPCKLHVAISKPRYVAAGSLEIFNYEVSTFPYQRAYAANFVDQTSIGMART